MSVSSKPFYCMLIVLYTIVLNRFINGMMILGLFCPV